jgi:hypothetical protein
MAYQLKKPDLQPVPKTRPAKRSSYLAWLHTLPCVVTGRNDIQAAHVSFQNTWHGHYGRARGTKAPDRFALPLCVSEHARQHSMNEAEYWRQIEINPHELANTLFGLWSDYDEYEATTRATARILSGLAVNNRLPSRDLA